MANEPATAPKKPLTRPASASQQLAQARVSGRTTQGDATTVSARPASAGTTTRNKRGTAPAAATDAPGAKGSQKSAPSRSGNRENNKKSGGASIYVVCGLVIAIGAGYLFYNKSSSPAPQTTAEPERKALSSNFVPPEVSDKTIEANVSELAKQAQSKDANAFSNADKKAMIVLARAQEIYRLGCEQSGTKRNDYFKYVKELCEKVLAIQGVSERFQQEANQLRYTATKGTTL